MVLALFMNSSADSRFFLLVRMGMVGNGMIFLLEGKKPKVPLLDSLGFDFAMEEGTS